MKIRNLIVGMLYIFILAGFSGLVEATRRQSYNFQPEDSMPCFVPKPEHIDAGRAEPEKNFGKS